MTIDPDVALHVRLLGPVELVLSGVPVPLGSRQQRATLAVLALSAGRPVPPAELADLLWPAPAAPPAGARSAVQGLISRLRRALREAGVGTGTLRATAEGYLLDLPTERVDAHRFAALAGLGRAELARGRPAEARALLETALGLWRGPALADLAGPFAERRRAELEAGRRRAEADRVDAVRQEPRSPALYPDDERLLAQLSVFRGGWTLAAAEAVCGVEVIDALERLVAHRAVLADGSGRFRMPDDAPGHDPLPSPDPGSASREECARRHAEYYAVEAGRASGRAGGDRAWLDTEGRNLAAATEWAARQETDALLGRLVSAQLEHWFHDGRIARAGRWTGRSGQAGRSGGTGPTDHGAPTAESEDQARMLLAAGNLALVAGDLPRAGPELDRAHRAALRAGDAALVSRTLAARSVVARHRGDLRTALALVDAATTAALTCGDAGLLARLGNERGELAAERGDAAEAEPLFLAFYDWAQAAGSDAAQALALVNLAGLACGWGEETAARRLLGGALAAAAAGDSAPLRGDVLAATALVRLRIDRPAEAGRALREAALLMHSAGQLLTLPDAVSLLAVSALALGHRRTGPAVGRRCAARLLAAADAWRSPRGMAVASPTAARLVDRAEVVLRPAESSGPGGRRREGSAPAAREPNGTRAADTRVSGRGEPRDPLATDRSLGAAVPFADLAAIARLSGGDQLWVADLRAGRRIRSAPAGPLRPG